MCRLNNLSENVYYIQMAEILKKMWKNWFPKNTEKDRQTIIRKVEEGTDKAVREYGEVFKKLEEYDRS